MTTIKKTTSKIKKTIQKVTGQLYEVTAIINGQEIKASGDNLTELMYSIKPSQVLIESYITVKKGGLESTRNMSLYQTRRLFNDPVVMEVFVNTIIAK